MRRVDGDEHKRRVAKPDPHLHRMRRRRGDQPERHPPVRICHPTAVLVSAAELHRRMAVTELSRPRGARFRADAPDAAHRVHAPASIAVGRLPDPRGDVPGTLRGAPLHPLRRCGNTFAHMVVLGGMGAHDRRVGARPRLGGTARQGDARRRCRRARHRCRWAPGISCTPHWRIRTGRPRRTSRSARRTGSQHTRTWGRACSTSTAGAAI